MLPVFLFIKKQPTVSVVMPTYNRADLLPRAIDSILNQTFKDFEFIIVDDGSTDNTGKILEQYKKKDKRIVVITHSTNKGVSTARNTGNQKARGKYIVIMDSDDIAKPHLLEKSLEFMRKNPQITIAVPIRNAYKEGTDPLLKNYYWSFPIHQIIFGSRLGNVGIIFNRRFMKKNNITYNPSFTCAEDYDFWIKMIKAGARLDSIKTPDSLIITRHHLSNPKTYYESCNQNSHEVKIGFQKFLNIPQDKRDDLCFILKQALKRNPRFFSQETIKDAKKDYCLPEKYFYIQIIHPFWSDSLVFSSDKTHVSRNQTQKETATVISFTPQKEITIKWDR